MCYLYFIIYSLPYILEAHVFYRDRGNVCCNDCLTSWPILVTFGVNIMSLEGAKMECFFISYH